MMNSYRMLLATAPLAIGMLIAQNNPQIGEMQEPVLRLPVEVGIFLSSIYTLWGIAKPALEKTRSIVSLTLLRS